jgi:hypothetical protein
MISYPFEDTVGFKEYAHLDHFKAIENNWKILTRLPFCPGFSKTSRFRRFDSIWISNQYPVDMEFLEDNF